MAPPMTFRMARHLSLRRPIAILADIEHPDGNGRFWSGIGSLQWQGNTFTGSGGLGTVTPIKHTSVLAVQEIQFQMSGVDPEIAARLNDNVRNKSGKVWLAGIWRRSLVPNPYELLDAELDYQNYDVDESGVAAVSIIGRSGFYTLERNIDEAWTSENQKTLYPDDTGLDMIPGLQNQDVIWSPT